MVTMSVAIFALGTAPLEVQRRIVNTSTTTGSFTTIALLALVYLALNLSEGLIKVVFNPYTIGIGERAIQWLRLFVLRKSEGGGILFPGMANQAIQLSIVLDEAEPVGGFVGSRLTQPILQGGILVCGYLFYLQPLIVAVVLLPQVGFAP
ncbi:hypothetical protein [Rhizobium tubonense]|uniref:Uncharacterized protein n=1 Tax=Rhizobium tubonense TaxID=484088 RepID=A0A2W4CKJ2_9HYPH|nr:hypothetical protein [Rhizobium tubonense]PZM10985.1 hypothetical protein CPY51_21600 [Rhizobium tubonense]